VRKSLVLAKHLHDQKQRQQLAWSSSHMQHALPTRRSESMTKGCTLRGKEGKVKYGEWMQTGPRRGVRRYKISEHNMALV